MARIKMTYDIAHRAAWDAGDRSMRKAGRKHWNEHDREVARLEMERLYPEEVEMREKARSHGFSDCGCATGLSGRDEFAWDEEDFEGFVRGYSECAVWASLDLSTGENFEGDPDLAEEAIEEFRKDCRDFVDANLPDLVASDLDPSLAGHDFWLTRNHHGSGFWDEGLGDVGNRLTNAAHAYGEQNLYTGDDGLVYIN